MSSILDIYSALAAKAISLSNTVAYKDVTLAVKNLDALPESATGILPVRLLLPFGSDAEQNHESTPVAFGDNPASDYTWKVTELMLWREFGDGAGLASVANDLVRYTGAYLKMLRSFRYPTNPPDYNQSVLVSARVSRGVFEYPAGSGSTYFGVECILTVNEIVDGEEASS